jgi:hypothetical protein
MRSLDLLVIVHGPVSRALVTVLAQDCLAISLDFDADAKQKFVDPIGIALQIVVCWFDVVEKGLDIL